VSKDSLPPELARRKKGKPIVFFDKYHAEHRASRLRSYYRKKWYEEHQQEEQRGWQEAMAESTEAVPDSVLEEWEKERRELQEPDEN